MKRDLRLKQGLTTQIKCLFRKKLRRNFLLKRTRMSATRDDSARLRAKQNDKLIWKKLFCTSYLPTYLPNYLLTYLLPTYLPTYLPTCLPTYIPIYLRTYLPTYEPT